MVIDVERGSSGILVYAQRNYNKVSEPTLELLGKARKLADNIGVELSSILVGFGISSLAYELISYGSDKVYVAEHEKLINYTTMPYARILADLIEKEKPQVVLFSANSIGRDLAPRIAARLETGLTADCVDLDIGDFEDRESGRTYKGILLQKVPAFGGNILATIVTPERWPQMATVRPGTFDLPKRDLSRKGEIVRCEVDLSDLDHVVEVVEVIARQTEADFKGAKIIVGGGRGVGGSKGFELIRKLADLLGAQVGATRAATDSGWIPESHMIGLTGQTVKPDIYIACGISGAIHHVMGIRNSKRIIAINKDPNAPIFDVADCGIVGDLFEVIPKLIERIESYTPSAGRE